MIGRVNTGGGGGLNFKVVGGTDAPSNPKENMIWINTSTAITDWVFSATQPPETSSRVWISIGTSSAVEFNALKKNGIQVYPISAKQYVSGAWVDKTAKSYQNGKWVDWIRYIFDNGVVKEGGSWQSTISGGYITQAIDIPTSSKKIFTHNEPVNVSGYTKATFVIKSSSPVYSYTEVGIYSEPGFAANLTPIAFANSDSYTSNEDVELSFMIPSGITECYFGFGVNRSGSGGATTTIKVKSIRIE